MAKKNKSKKNNKKKNVAEAPSVKPIPDSPPPPVSPKRTYNEMKNEAFAIVATAFDKYDLDERIAEEIKREFDSRYGPTWHCIVGNRFGSSVACEEGYHFYFNFRPKEIILFKCG